MIDTKSCSLINERILLSPQNEERSKKYYFELPSDVWELRINCFALSKEPGTLQCLLWDADRLRGCVTNPKDELVLSEDWASEGFYKGPVKKGKWFLEVKTPKLHRGQHCPDFEVRINLIYKKNTPQVLKGDLHMHTIYGDGSLTPHQVCELASKNGLDFISITDHNHTAQNLEQLSSEELIVVPGSEYSTAGGDCNIFGVAEPYNNPYRDLLPQVQHVLDSCREQGAIVSVNHPFIKSNPWLWGINECKFKFIELWRGGWNQFNEKTLSWWHNELCKGNRMVALCGSDIHHENQNRSIGIPPTAFVRVEKPTVEGILKAMRQGNLSIGNSPEAPYIFFDYAERQDSVDKKNIILTIENHKAGILTIHTAMGKEEITIPKDSNKIQFSITEDELFCRAEYWPVDSQNEPLCLTNPIYFFK